jgi:hypothetical protein
MSVRSAVAAPAGSGQRARRCDEGRAPVAQELAAPRDAPPPPADPAGGKHAAPADGAPGGDAAAAAAAAGALERALEAANAVVDAVDFARERLDAAAAAAAAAARNGGRRWRGSRRLCVLHHVTGVVCACG